MLWSCAAGALAGADAGAVADDLVETILEVTLNAEARGDSLIVLRGPGGMLYLDDADFEKLRLHPPAIPALERDGRRFHAPAAIQGCTVVIDEVRQRAVITAPPAALDTTYLRAAEREHPPVTPAAPGAFFNYQVSAQQIQGQTTGGVYGELGLFAGPGVLTNTAVAREAQLVRLDTTFTRDLPERLETFCVGDAISDPGSWGDAVRFAGIRWSRNFGLRPDLLTTPLLSTGGTATVPSTADVFVNNQLVSSSQVPAGPFVVDRLPTVSGTGDVSVVVRDALGREQVTTQTFYSSTVLLAPGLTQYSVNLGSVRDDYALESNRYAGTLAEVTYRRGITDTFTLEGHGEYLSADAHAAGVNAGFGMGRLGVLNVTAAGGGIDGGMGWLRGAGFEHRGASVSVIASTLWAGNGFAQVGEPVDPDLRMRQRSLAQVGIGLGRFGSLSLAYVRQTYRYSPAQQTLSLTHGVSLGRAGAINLTVSQTRTAAGFSDSAASSTAAASSIAAASSTPSAGQNSTSAYLIYVHPFGGRSSLSTTAVNGSGPGAPDNQVIATLSESPPVGPGSGYRLSASTAGNYDADWHQQLAAAEFEVEAARNQGIEGRSAYATGAVTWLDGEMNATRSVNGSFAVVDLAGLDHVPVYVENQLTTYTDASGRALIYNLRPYEANQISIVPEDLPLDTAIASRTAVVAPPYRSGVVARFPVEKIRGATLRLVTGDGKPVRVGATVRLAGSEFPVVQAGRVYVTGYDRGATGRATWHDGYCTFRLGTPPSDELQPDLGTIECR
jgi:outer membrane usher protein